MMSEWIPCSERMPDAANGCVLVTALNQMSSGTKYKTVETAWTDDDKWVSTVPIDEVIAWMPLPKPYEGGDNA